MTFSRFSSHSISIKPFIYNLKVGFYYFWSFINRIEYVVVGIDTEIVVSNEKKHVFEV